MKIIYGLVLLVIFIMILIIYFTNVIFLSGITMYLFNRSYYVSLPTGLLILILLSVAFGSVMVLFIQSFIKWKPKDLLDEEF